MNVSFKNSFLKEIQKIKDVDLKENIMSIIADVEESGAFTDIKNFKKLKG
jgi:Txe/YoeB family toxin of Txe-Axe toxin-antitoxin module